VTHSETHLGIKSLHAAVDMRGDVMIKPRSLASVRRIRRARGEGGFTLIEAVFAMVLFAGLAAAMAGLLTSAISGNKLSRQRTIADQVAMEQIESIRRLDYEDVGTILGNPPGTWPATTAVNVAGFDATVTVQIRYVDDPTPTSYETTANYKRVIVTVRRDSDNRVLAREVTYVAPTSRTPFGGVNLAIIEPLVIDYGLNVPVEGVTVDLLTGPDAPRSDVTDATGKVSFKKLTPNATATCPSDCYDLTADLPGYVQLDAPTRINVGPGQTATPTIQIYRPSTITLDLRNSGGGQLAGTAFVKLTSARNGITQTFTVTGGTAAITTVAGEPIVPSVQYTAEAWTTGTPQCATPVTQYVPDDYPDDLTSTFTLTMGACPSGSIAATVTWGSGGPAAAGATVTISGGPYSLTPTSGTTNSSGQVTFSNVPSGTGYTVQASQYSQSASQTVAVTTGNTTNVTLPLTAGSLTVQVRWAGVAVSGATVQVTSLSRGVNQTLTTPASGNVTFSGLPPGTDYQVVATKSGQSRTLSPVTVTGSPSTVTANLPTGTVVVTVLTGGGGNPGTAASVRIKLGPMNISVSGTTNTSGVVTFTNVPAGTGYTFQAWVTACSGTTRSRQNTNQTVNAATNNVTLQYNATTCPLT
jgi:type II secretory pathway pseudopilin PulG